MHIDQRLSDFPPMLVWLLSRHRKLPEFWMERLGCEPSWNHVTVPDLLAFTRACQCDFFNPAHMRRVDDYLRKKPTFAYLRSHPEWRSRWLPLLLTWAGHCQPLHPHLRNIKARLLGVGSPKPEPNPTTSK